MKTRPKKFDCVAMKRAGAAAVHRITRGMTFRQRVGFWRKETEALLAEKQAAATKKGRGA